MFNRIYKLIFCFLPAGLFLFLFSGCVNKEINNTAGRFVSVADTGEYFGTIITITLYGDGEEQLNAIMAEAFQECGRLENIFSAKIDTSELSVMNREASKQPVKVSDELFQVLSQSIACNEKTNGAFDVSIGKLIDLWGIGTENQRIPPEAEIAPFVGARGCEDILFDEENHTVCYASDMVKVDLGAIAKGYAADKVKEYLMSQPQVKAALLYFGGNIMTVGEKMDGSSWNIGITDPERPGQVCAAVSVKDKCVVTSGNYERYFEADGRRYHHILDPSTGYPASRGLVSTTVIGGNSAECDALSTACYILGKDKALELIESIEGVECVLIDESGVFHCSSGMEQYNFREIK